MNVSTNENKREATRRLVDQHLKAQVEKYSRLIQAGQIITSELNVDAPFDVISNQTRKVLDVERCSIFLVDEMDSRVLKKVCSGLLKNAIENTPDEGTIKLKAGATADDIFLEFQDYGIGIASADGKNIFKGFFHTQPTRFYSSKTPYAFNAGGTGTDLLRMRTYAERLGFKIDFSSRRCRFIPADTDTCPRRVSLCNHITAEMDCLVSGGSLFTVRFPRIGHLTDTPSFYTCPGISWPSWTCSWMMY